MICGQWNSGSTTFSCCAGSSMGIMVVHTHYSLLCCYGPGAYCWPLAPFNRQPESVESCDAAALDRDYLAESWCINTRPSGDACGLPLAPGLRLSAG